MKKLLIIITLFVSSFFLFCRNEVKADVTVTDTDIDTYITEDFLIKRSYIMQFAIEHNCEYLIFKEGNYIRYVFLTANDIVSISSSTIYFSHYYLYTIDNDLNIKFLSESKNRSYYLSSTPVLDSSKKLYSSEGFNIFYNNKTYLVNENTPFYTYYDIYNEINSVPEENPHQEEIDKVTNFYTMVIEKISYLAEQIANNYILLSIIGIFIVTFIFLLIFRRFL